MAWEHFKAFCKDVDVIGTSHRGFTLAELAALEKELAASLEQETGVGVGDAVAPGVTAMSLQSPRGADAAEAAEV